MRHNSMCSCRSQAFHEQLSHLWGAAHPAVSTDSAGRKEPSRFGGAMEATSTPSSRLPAADRAKQQSGAMLVHMAMS